MLDPDDRTLYTELLSPPAGTRFDFAVATSYSLDLDVLLAVPIQLALGASEDSAELMRDPVTLYDALKRVSSRLKIYIQAAGTHAPANPHLLYSLLEPVISEVQAPRGGVFHPKLWALRFVDEQDQPFYRLVICSRNITADRSWDVAVTVEGEPGLSPRPANEPLARLVRSLPTLAGNPTDPDVDRMAAELEKIEWQLPEGFSDLRFHVLGLDGSAWQPPASENLLVISPFVSDRALSALAKTSNQPLAVVSRGEALAGLQETIPFGSALCLHEAAETDDGEDVADAVELGLHAKAYVSQIDNTLYFTLGSANATDAALVSRKNVEILAELTGRTPELGGPARLLDPNLKDGLGQLLMPWKVGDDAPADETVKARDQIFRAAREALANAELTVTCRKEDGEWRSFLDPIGSIDLEGIERIRAWPATVTRDLASDASGLHRGENVALANQAIASLTGLIAFELSIEKDAVAFTLNLPVEGLPEARESAILRHVVSNRQGFLRYLLLLLAGIGDSANVAAVARAFNSQSFTRFHNRSSDFPLLEEMVRAYAREPHRLKRVRRLVQELSRHEESVDILPEGFIEFWQVFEEAIGEGVTDGR